MKITLLDYLIKNKACKEYISFVKRNNLNNFPIDKLQEVKGDYLEFIEWITTKLETIKKYDDKGNKIYEKFPDGIEYHWKYDEKGNKTYEKDPEGDEYYWEYEYYKNGQLKSIKENDVETLFIPEIQLEENGSEKTS